MVLLKWEGRHKVGLGLLLSNFPNAHRRPCWLGGRLGDQLTAQVAGLEETGVVLKAF